MSVQEEWDNGTKFYTHKHSSGNINGIYACIDTLLSARPARWPCNGHLVPQTMSYTSSSAHSPLTTYYLLRFVSLGSLAGVRQSMSYPPQLLTKISIPQRQINKIKQSVLSKHIYQLQEIVCAMRGLITLCLCGSVPAE